MRWYIEISQEGQPTQKLCLDAAHWQPALQKAREIQGESGKLKGLAVEILEEGCRAVDSDHGMTYVVTPAADGASLVESLGEPQRDEDASKPDEPKASSPRASLRGRRSRREKLSQRRKQRRESKPPEPEETPMAGKSVAKKTMMLGSQVPPRQPESASADAIDTIGYASQGEAIITEESKPPKSDKPGRVVPPDPEAPPVSVPAAKKKTDVGQQLISERNENASKDNPLRYHERVYAVKLPQPLASLDAFLREMLGELRDGLDDAGHVIRVAIYDHSFGGKPKTPPIATVAWYGWRNDSEVVFFPYAERPASSLAAAEKFIGSDTLGPGNVPSPAPKRDLEAEKRAEQARLAAERKKAEKAAEAARQAEEARKADAARKAAEAQREEARRVEEKKAEEAKKAASAKRAADERAEAKKTAEKKAEERRESDKRDVERIAEAKRAADDKSELGKTATLGSGVKRGSRRSLRDRKSVEPKAPSKPVNESGNKLPDKSPDKSPNKSDSKSDNGARVSSAPGERRVKLGRGSQELRASDPGDEPPLTREQKDSRLAAARLEVESLPPPLSVPGNRVAGEQLLTDLFEEIAQLHYLEDALEGADFVLQLALQKLPSEVGLVSLFDIDKREYVVVRQTGGERSALLLRVNERAEVPRRAMRKSRAVVLPDVRKASETVDARWDKIGTAPRSMICAPVEKAGRYLGLIELLNPHDGKAFSESDGHALTYIGQQYGEFLSNRGVTLDPDAVVATARR